MDPATDAAEGGRDRGLTIEQRRRDLVLETICADELEGTSSGIGLSELASEVATAARSRSAPDLIRGRHRTAGFQETVRSALDTWGPLLGCGSAGLARLLRDPPREIKLGRTALAHVSVFSNGPGRRKLVIAKAARPTGASSPILDDLVIDEHDADSLSALNALADLAMNAAFILADQPRRQAVVLLGPKASASVSSREWLTARLAVTGRHVEVLTLANLADVRLVTNVRSRVLSLVEPTIPLITFSEPSEGRVLEIAKARPAGVDLARTELVDSPDAIATEIEERLQSLQGRREELGTDREPQTVKEAVELAASRCPDLVFTPSAYRSAEGSQFSSPVDVLADLVLLQNVASRWASGALVGDFREAFDECPATYRSGISQTAATQYASDYEISYRGRTVRMGPHLRRGVGAPSTILRIYWYKDDANKKLVVGHVGRKLRDASNSN